MRGMNSTPAFPMAGLTPRRATGLPVNISRREVLRYMGIPERNQSTVDNALLGRVESAIAWASWHLRPCGIFATYPAIVGGASVRVTGSSPPLILPSRDLAARLAGCHAVSILAVTAGGELDAAVDRMTTAGQLVDAAILDAVGSDCVEQAAATMSHWIATTARGAGYSITERYSPGYGDLSLDCQPDILQAVAGSEAGITVLPSLMMLPLKSITAMVGWLPGNQPQPSAQSVDCAIPCALCNLARCHFRKQLQSTR